MNNGSFPKQKQISPDESVFKKQVLGFEYKHYKIYSLKKIEMIVIWQSSFLVVSVHILMCFRVNEINLLILFSGVFNSIYGFAGSGVLKTNFATNCYTKSLSVLRCLFWLVDFFLLVIR